MRKFLLPLGLAAQLFNPVFAQTLTAAPADAVGNDNSPPLLVHKATVWSLADSVQRIHDIAPELRTAEAEIAAREAELEQADVWPNPTVDIRADNRLGIEDGSGGSGLTQFALSQPLPLRRLVRQRAVAEANLDSARENLRNQQLLLEREVARAFHALQLAEAKRQLSLERLQLVAELPGIARKKSADGLVRYLTPLERQRLAILSEEASQAAVTAEREQQKALIDFRALLALQDGAPVKLTKIAPPQTPASLDVYVRALDTHPALAAARKQSEAAQAGIAVAESQRYADPSLNLFRERDFLAGQRRDVTGIGVSVQIPLWNNSSGLVAKAGADAGRAQAQLATMQRNAYSSLAQAHFQLVRLLEQTERLRVNLLEPAREVYALTRRGFGAGELNVLTLVDANNTYFDAHTRHLQLQQESALAAADLRLAAGISVIDFPKEVAP